MRFSPPPDGYLRARRAQRASHDEELTQCTRDHAHASATLLARESRAVSHVELGHGRAGCQCACEELGADHRSIGREVELLHERAPHQLERAVYVADGEAE